MVEIADIKDKDSLQAWLKDQHGQVSVWIAARAAARALPIWWQAVVPRDWGRKRDVFMLPILRGLLISKVASFVPTDDIRFAAHAARDAANAAFTAHGAHAATNAAAAHPDMSRSRLVITPTLISSLRKPSSTARTLGSNAATLP